jgi:hypothetical protein
MTVGIVDTNPVVLTGGESEVEVERALAGLSIGPKYYVLTFVNLSVHVAQGHGVFLAVSGVVGDVDSGDLERSIVGVEKLNPCFVLTVVIYIV